MGNQKGINQDWPSGFCSVGDQYVDAFQIELMRNPASQIQKVLRIAE